MPIDFLKKLPVIRTVPGFNTLPAGLASENVRFYKLSNLVLTLGMFTHASWLVLFFLLDLHDLAVVNLFSVLIYVMCIMINRRGFHFTSSAIMVLEIIAHQVIVVPILGWEAGFQYYVLVIIMLPFLMPQGRWVIKSVMLLSCVLAYLWMDYRYEGALPLVALSGNFLWVFKVTNILFSITYLAISGAYFTNAMHQTESELIAEQKKSDDLLLNILPEETAQELKETGTAQSRHFELVTVIFTDFKNFTRYSENISAGDLVREIHFYYSAFDRIIEKYNIEKIKTIGDGYMCVGGLPVSNTTNPADAVYAAIELRDFIAGVKKEREAAGQRFFDVRIGIHSGPVIAGIVGVKKFAYDIWGDTVNVASRMESSGAAGEINISGTTYELVRDRFECEYRGKIDVKNKDQMDMYFVCCAKAENQA